MSEKVMQDWRFIIPDAVCLYKNRSVPGGAMTPGAAFDVQPDPRLIMTCIWYTTQKRIHGLWHFDRGNQMFFVGYECQECHEVYLVPDSVKSQATLSDAMRHGCSEGL